MGPRKRFLTINGIDDESPQIRYTENDPHRTPTYSDTEDELPTQPPRPQDPRPQDPSPKISSSSSKISKRSLKLRSEVWDWFTRYEALHPGQDYEVSGKFNAPLTYVESNLSQPQTAAERIGESTRRGAHSGRGSKELSRYLESDTIDDVDFDVLKWWKVNEIKFPILAAIARDILTIPVSTIASKAAFSGARRLMADYRSSLAPDTIEATMCLRDWYLAEDKNQDKLLQGSEEELELE
ncbi:hypothetical protein GIB67_008745 [Kingdonia uniflora]|uniref:HAT C-terminal dimerisation domain-containing protein n=1 Tax=Kingdonia uniflora TaxID=39325 RepID=A0A7J7P5S2_9MAGN|nr:hypothetical protein GIB67_008745 [Kingdonia uniflora]